MEVWLLACGPLTSTYRETYHLGLSVRFLLVTSRYWIKTKSFSKDVLFGGYQPLSSFLPYPIDIYFVAISFLVEKDPYETIHW